MKFNDTAPLLPRPSGPPPWLSKLANDATLEAAVLKRPVHGKEDILAIIQAAIPLYEFQNFTYRGEIGSNFFMESYRAQIRGVSIECAVWVHINEIGETDSILINHYPLKAALLFSALMGKSMGGRLSDLYLTESEAEGLKVFPASQE